MRRLKGTPPPRGGQCTPRGSTARPGPMHPEALRRVPLVGVAKASRGKSLTRPPEKEVYDCKSATVKVPARVYWLAAPLCVLVPFVPAGSGHVQWDRSFPFVFVALPMAAASCALGAAHWQRRTRGTLETLAAGMWLLAAVSLTLPGAVWDESDQPATLLHRSHVCVVGLSAVLLLLSSLRAWLQRDAGRSLLSRSLQAGGGLVLALPLARSSLTAFVSLPISHSEGLARLVVEAEFFAGIVLSGAVAIGVGAASDVFRRRRLGL
jgi:hypothetical protein